MSRVLVVHWDFDEVGDLLRSQIGGDDLAVFALADELRRDGGGEREAADGVVAGGVIFGSIAGFLGGVGGFVGVIEDHAVDAAAAGVLVDEIKHGNFDGELGFDHLVGDAVVDFGIVGLGRNIFEVGEKFSPLVIGKAAADAADDLERTLRPHDGDEHVVQHAGAVVGAFGVADDGDIEGGAGFDFVHAGGIGAGDEAFAAVFFDPLIVELVDGGLVFGVDGFDGVDEFSLRFEDGFDFGEDFVVARGGGFAVDFEDVEDGEAQGLEGGGGFGLAGDAADIMDARAFVGAVNVKFGGEEDFLVMPALAMSLAASWRTGSPVRTVPPGLMRMAVSGVARRMENSPSIFRET